MILYFLFSLPSPSNVKIKYRSDKVNVAISNFTFLSKSDSTVKGVWYDGDNEHVAVKLGNTYYHFCGVLSSAWPDL